MWQDLGESGGTLPFVAQQLRYSPPVLVSPTTIDVTQALADSGSGVVTLTLSTTQDYRITLPTEAELVGKTVTIRGGRNYIIEEGSIRASAPAVSAVRGLIRMIGQAGIAYMEGIELDIDLMYGLDGILVGANTSYASRGSLCIQNCRVNALYSKVAGLHSDGFQYYGDTAFLYQDRLTITTDYQGDFVDPQHRNCGIYVSNVNIKAHSAYGKYNGYPFIPHNSGVNPEGYNPVFDFENIYVEPRQDVPDYYFLVDSITNIPQVTGSFTFTLNPSAGHILYMGSFIDWTFVASGATGRQTNIQASLTLTLDQLVIDLNASAQADIATCTYSNIGGNKLGIVQDVLDPNGSTYSLATNNSNAVASGTSLDGMFNTVSLRDAVVSVGGTIPGNEIGTARMCSLEPAGGGQYKLFFYDVQMNADKVFADVKSVGLDATADFTANVVLSSGLLEVINDHAPLDPALWWPHYTFIPTVDAEVNYPSILVGNEITFTFPNYHGRNVKIGSPPRGDYCPAGFAGYGYSARIDSMLPGGRYRTDATAPGAPTGLAGTATTSGVQLKFVAPNNNGGDFIIDYVVQYKLASEPTVWTTFSHNPNILGVITVYGLLQDTAYDFRVACTNRTGTGAYSSTVTVTNTAIPIDPTGATKVSDFLPGIVVAEYPLGSTACYDGLSKILHNIEPSPPIGVQTDYDIYLGSNSVSGTVDDPIAVGTPGAAGFHFDCTGDYWKLLNAMTAYFKNLHKTTGGQDFSALIVAKFPDMVSGDLNGTVFATNILSNDPGTRILHSLQGSVGSQAGVLGLTARGSGTSTVFASTPVQTGQPVFMGAGHGSNITSFWQGSPEAEEIAQTFTSNTTDANGVAWAAQNAGGNRLKATSSWYYMILFNKRLETREAIALCTYLDTLLGFDVTPAG